MDKNEKSVKVKFDLLFKEWENYIINSKIILSSRTSDYIDNEPYQKIIDLGKEALPYVIAKIQDGVFFMNEAALQMINYTINDLIALENKEYVSGKLILKSTNQTNFLSEQQKSNLILKHLPKQYLPKKS